MAPAHCVISEAGGSRKRIAFMPCIPNSRSWVRTLSPGQTGYGYFRSRTEPGKALTSIPTTIIAWRCVFRWQHSDLRRLQFWIRIVSVKPSPITLRYSKIWCTHELERERIKHTRYYD